MCLMTMKTHVLMVSKHENTVRYVAIYQSQKELSSTFRLAELTTTGFMIARHLNTVNNKSMTEVD